MALEMEHIRLEVADAVAWITLDRPDQLNAFAGGMRDELLHGLLHAQENDAVRVAVLTGAGRAFCAGGDVSRMVELKDEGAGPEALRPFLDAGGQVVRLIQELPKPVIAMVNGVAAGAGCNLALACDLRIASERASFAQSFVKVGLAPDWGGTWTLPRIVGVARAQELMWTGRRVEAEEALELGLAHEVVAPERLRDRVTELARRLAASPATSLHMIKLAMQTTLTQDLEGMLEFEAEAQARCWDSPDSAEGLRAFAQKRPPRFG